MEFRLTYVYIILFCAIKIGVCMKCYECESGNNPACGVSFKSYQFTAVQCKQDEKCGLQRQEPDKDNFVGILRRCYRLGDLAGIDESDGCRYWTTQSFTAKYCFCSTDYCNGGSRLTSGGGLIAILTSVTSVLMLNILL